LVGSSIAFLCATNALDDIVLLNRTKSKAFGEALDISNAIPKNSDITVKGTDDYSEIGNSEIIVITASTGVYLKNRNEMIGAQVKMVRNIAKEIKKTCKSPIVLIISNPVDVLTYFFIKETGFSKDRVIGIASELDSSRFRYSLSKKMGVKQSQISDAFVLGEHGDSMVPIFSNTKIDGKNVLDFLTPSQKSEIKIEIRDYWKLLRNFKSRSQFGISKSTFDVLYSILNNQSLLSPTSILLDGEYNQKNVCMGVLTTIDSKGISKIHQPELDESEKNSLRLSAQAIRKNIESI
jgi:malate dehydrogenase